MGMLGSATLTHAEATDIRLGWMNLPECSRAVCSGTGLFCPDTIQYAPQELSGYAHIEAPDLNSVIASVNHCAFNVALPTATLAAILANPASAQPAFSSAFSACMTEKSSKWTGLSLYTKTECRW